MVGVRFKCRDRGRVRVSVRVKAQKNKLLENFSWSVFVHFLAWGGPRPIFINRTRRREVEIKVDRDKLESLQKTMGGSEK